MDNLLPCPFCGGEARMHASHHGDTHYYQVECGNEYDCGAWPAVRVSHTEAEAVEAWNTRAAYEIDGWFYLPKPKQDIAYTSETMVQRTEHGYKMGAIADVYENAIREWQKQLNAYIIGRICDVFRPERTCSIVKTWSDSDYVGGWRYRCSECRCFIPVDECDPETGDVISAANYCPNCGAKVIGGNHA